MTKSAPRFILTKDDPRAGNKVKQEAP